MQNLLQKLDLTHRIVHLDLKGAPPRIPYLEKVIVRLKSWGATGILLEWEDTFPYSGDLMEIGSSSNAGGDNMYSLAETQHILQFIKYNGLDPIQLIQTIGHMEFVLKYPVFKDLREISKSAAVLCPSRPRSQEVVREMINQTLDAQPDAKFFHIGADEVWHMGVCAQCQERGPNDGTKAAVLYLDHIQSIVLYIKEKRPDITVLMWDDMLRTLPVQMLQEYKLGELVMPVWWNYNAVPTFIMSTELVNLYSQVFPQLMFGTAYKGANGSCRMMSPVSRYMSNQKAWIAFANNNPSIKFCGAILTGWSRYDHYATLCELLPTSLPSLCVCLRILNEVDGINIREDDPSNEVLPSSEWPGEIMAECVRALMIMEERCDGLLNSETVKTWLNPWQISRKYTTPGHVQIIVENAERTLSQIMLVKNEGHKILLQITGERSAEEWILTNVEPWVQKITRLHEIAQVRSHSRPSIRPLVIE